MTLLSPNLLPSVSSPTIVITQSIPYLKVSPSTPVTLSPPPTLLPCHQWTPQPQGSPFSLHPGSSSQNPPSYTPSQIPLQRFPKSPLNVHFPYLVKLELTKLLTSSSYFSFCN